ncbi:Hypothetical protein NTJ_13415 [Nesidiocoris tenuis]|uniref:Uncharacterized protein n=1 Tax=Nesidiocoris tenuis TaxID=355587 RepID=A0ABN7B8M5_9HEMI|nr:Hypothetical protein NTJ_13415 [Nesidiocoris tenuis]
MFWLYFNFFIWLGRFRLNWDDAVVRLPGRIWICSDDSTGFRVDPISYSGLWINVVGRAGFRIYSICNASFWLCLGGNHLWIKCDSFNFLKLNQCHGDSHTGGAFLIPRSPRRCTWNLRGHDVQHRQRKFCSSESLCTEGKEEITGAQIIKKNPRHDCPKLPKLNQHEDEEFCFLKC